MVLRSGLTIGAIHNGEWLYGTLGPLNARRQCELPGLDRSSFYDHAPPKISTVSAFDAPDRKAVGLQTWEGNSSKTAWICLT